MHVLLISNYPPGYQGGVGFVVAQLAAQYRAVGHRVTILACPMPEGAPTLIEGVRLITVRAWNGLEKRGVPLPIFDPIALTAALAEVLRDVDAVHLHGLLYMNSWWAAAMSRARRIPVIVTEHVGEIDLGSRALNGAQGIAWRTIARWCAGQCGAVVVLNGRVAASVAPLIRSGTLIQKIANGVDTALFHPLDLDERAALRARYGFSKPTIVFAGRYSRKKGIDLVIETARRLPDAEIVICGKGYEPLGEAIAPARWLGVLDQPALAGVYAAADAVLLPSEGEGFPLVIQEALACGAPVIVTDNAVNHEYLDASVAVFVPRDARAIAAAASVLLTDNDRRMMMRIAARRWAESFDWARTAAAYLALFDQLHAYQEQR